MKLHPNSSAALSTSSGTRSYVAASRPNGSAIPQRSASIAGNLISSDARFIAEKCFSRFLAIAFSQLDSVTTLVRVELIVEFN